MKFNRDLLLEAVSNATAIALPRTPLPILGCVVISPVKKDVVTIKATDGEVWVGYPVECEGDLATPVATNAKRLKDVVSIMTGDIVDLSLRHNRLVLSDGKSKLTLNTMDAAEYPETPAEREFHSTMLGKDLRDLLGPTLRAASTNPARAHLNGIGLKARGDWIEAAGLDNPAMVATKKPADLEEPFACILPKKGAEAIVNSTPDDTTVAMDFHSGAFVVSWATGTIAARVIAGEFPDYRPHLAIPDGASAKIASQDFVNFVRRVAVLDGDMVLRIDKDGLHGEVPNSPNGDAETSEAAETTGEGQFACNPKFLLGVLPAGNLTIHLSDDPNRPAVITTDQDPELRAVVSAVRLGGGQ